MEYEIEWQDKVCSDAPKGVFLEVDPHMFGPITCAARYIDLRACSGEYLVWCARVRFFGATSPVKQNEIMQTVLMMARARYGR